MSYAETYHLKYYTQFVNERNELVRLEILSKSPLTSDFPKQIGELRDLQLNVLGSSSEVFAPIIKTELVFSMVDTWDIPSATAANGIKHGAWEEFYTPDSTAYMVCVKTSAPGSSTLAARWSGYITPDSWQEYIHYRGLITITARDNIGHLQNFDFDLAGDESGTASIRELIIAAMQKIGLAMDLEFNDTATGDIEVLQASGTTAGVLDLRVNVSLFKNDDWLTALSDVLEAIGYVMRYEDNNKVSVFPLRNLQACGTTSLNPGNVEVKFLDGTRTLDPAYKDITEEIEFEPKDKIDEDPRTGTSFNPNYSGTYSCLMLKTDGSSLGYTNGVRAEVKTDGPHWIGTAEQRRAFLNVDNYEIADAAQREDGDAYKEALFIVANVSGDSINPIWRYYMVKPEGKLTLSFKSKPGCLDSNRKLALGNAKLYKIGFRLSFVTQSGTTYYMSFQTAGGYQWYRTQGPETIESIMEDDDTELNWQFLSYSPDDGPLPDGYIQLQIMYIQYRCTDSTYSGNGCYARLENIKLEPWTMNGNLKSDKAHTINNATYNIRCTRNPRIGVLSAERTPSLPGFYEKALFCLDGDGKLIPAPYKWKWTSESAYTPFAVQIHKQILCFFHETTELLEGNCLPAPSSIAARFDKLLLYYGRKHIIMGGTLDFTTGRFNALRIRSFFTWDELWGDGPEEVISVSPTALDLTQITGASVRIECNTTWRAKTVPEGITLSITGGSGSAFVYILRDQDFSGGTVVFETTDGEHTASLTVVRQTTGVLTMVNTGSDLDDMSFPLITGIYSIEINFDPGDEGYVFLTVPNWLHFEDPDAEAGSISTPGIYGLYHDEVQSISQLGRDGYIEADGAGTGNHAQLYVRQTG